MPTFARIVSQVNGPGSSLICCLTEQQLLASQPTCMLQNSICLFIFPKSKTIDQTALACLLHQITPYHGCLVATPSFSQGVNQPEALHISDENSALCEYCTLSITPLVEPHNHLLTSPNHRTSVRAVRGTSNLPLLRTARVHRSTLTCASHTKRGSAHPSPDISRKRAPDRRNRWSSGSAPATTHQPTQRDSGIAGRGGHLSLLNYSRRGV